MKYKFIRQVDNPVPSYGGEMVETGSIVELEGHLAEKAKKNPFYIEVVQKPKSKAKPKAYAN